MNGNLFVIGTPIGNLGDMTQRGIETLNNVDIIAAEDTRHAKKLLQRYEVLTPTVSFHQHTKPEKILSLLGDGKNVALISDAGTPGISDPGTNLISFAINQGITVIPIPGPSALITALCASGLPTNHFEFFGFLPQKKGRQTFFKNLIDCKHTAIFYESTHRIEKCLKELDEFLPERTIVLGRELTKIYEEFLRGTASEILHTFEMFPEKKKGEFVLLVGAK